jgi:hypothetical protein
LNFGGGCFNLGLSYEEGKGVKQDDFKALKFFQKIILFNAFASFIHKSKKSATTAIIQTTRLLVKLECFEIILFNAFASVIHKSKKRATTAII